MKYKILLAAGCVLSLLSTGQKKTDKAFAIVSNELGKMGWMNIQEIDLATGQVIRTIFDKGKTGFVLMDATTKDKVLNQSSAFQANKSISYEHPTASLVVAAPNKIVNHGGAMQASNVLHQGGALPASKAIRYEHPTASMVAATAYDRRHNKLFFSPMRYGELRWIDLSDRSNSLKVHCAADQPFFPWESTYEGYQITRMVIAADGNGYALTNDAFELIRFTTGKKVMVTKLGKIDDDPSNKEFSIHGRNAWGGDMIADAAGNLYVIAANHDVFKINIAKKIATRIGAIEGLPQNYTTNGAAIDSKGNLVVSSAQSSEGYYKVDLATLQASKQSSNTQSVSCSDLASANLAFQPEEISRVERRIDVSFDRVSVFPNPVTTGVFKVNFAKSEFGRYDIQLADLNGRVISQKRVNVGILGQTEDIVADPKLAKGTYIINILNRSNKLVSSGKILLQ